MAAKNVWRKGDPALTARFAAALPVGKEVQRRQMFGYACAFVNGHFFAGMYEDRLVVRLPSPLRTGLGELADASIFDPRRTGKGMRDWWLVPRAVTDDPARLSEFLARCYARVRTLPPKAQRRKSAAAKSTKASAVHNRSAANTRAAKASAAPKTRKR